MPIPTDPLLAQQWHLHNNVAGLLDLNVFGVWNPTMGPAYTGAGIRAVVLDSGIDYTHSDLAPNYNLGLDFDLENNINDAFGTAGESHGTAVAGIIGAAANGTGAVGVAYGTELVGYRTAQFINDAWLQDIRDGIGFAATNALADVTNISQGIANDLNSEFGVGYNAVRFDEIETAIGTAVNTGRGGLGMSIVKSGGNSRGGAYDINADDWTNDTRQVVVAAVDQNGFVSSYSSYGAANLVSGFGTPGQVVTTDRVGAAGYNNTDFTSTFNGTSAAAPMVTGVVSLMYDANAGLGWRDVQSILASSARHVGSAVGGGIAGSEKYAWGFNAAGTWNGGGQHFSNDYGYGLVDALAAVRLSETWLLGGAPAQTTGNEFQNSMDVLNVATVIPDGNATGLSFTGNAIFDDIVDRVTVQMTFSTTFTGDINIFLTSPDGTVSRLIDRAGGGNDFNGTWTFESQAFRGERAAGNWTVRVADAAGGDVLNVSDIVIRTFGSATSNDRYIMTNEFSDYAGIFGHATNINDSNGGIDTVNAAAVSSNSTIRLDGVAGTIDGVGVIFNNIENAIGGDGNDTIYGSNGANLLYGQRGDDTINGGSGIDTLYGGWGDDTLDGGLFKDNSYGEEGNDRFRVTNGDFGDNVYGGNGTDTLDLSGWTNASIAFNVNLVTQNYQFLPNAYGVDGTYDAQSIENVTGSNYDDTITGDGVDNLLKGAGGNDTLFGGGGTDTIFGGEGNDTINGGLFKDDCYGENGDDTFKITGGDFGDNVYGGADTDTLDLSGWTNSSIAFNVNLNTQNYQFLPNAFGVNGTYDAQQIENVLGSNYSDTITGSSVRNVLQGLGGADSMFGLAGNDDLFGGAGIDYLSGGSEADYLSGGSENDTFFGGSGTDTMIGGAGDDQFYIQAGDASDIVIEYAGEGTNDRILSDISYALAAVSYVETLQTSSNAGVGSINLTGSDRVNTIIGNNGTNIIDGRGGNDILYGLGGTDYFTFSSAPNAANNIDRIADWDPIDLFFMDDAVFTGLAPGTLAASGFLSGAGLTSAATAAQRIIHNTTTGDLYYDADGVGGTAAQRFAIVGVGSVIANYDFFAY